MFATTSETGVPSARMVVVRGVNEKLAIEIHTDSRSNKVLDLQKNPQAEILFYDPLTEIQLKCFGGVLFFRGFRNFLPSGIGQRP